MLWEWQDAELIIPSQPFDKTKVIKEKNHIWILYKIDAIFWLVVLTTIFIIGIVRVHQNSLLILLCNNYLKRLIYLYEKNIR